MSLRAAFLSAALLAASGAAALDMPAGARLAQDQSRPIGSYAVPIAPYRNENVQSLILQGPMERQAWHIPDSALTPTQIIEFVRKQLNATGFIVAFECDRDRCGGFDFRFAIDVMEAPAIFVNLRDYHFATLLRGPEGAPEAAVTLLASRAQGQLYVQISTINSEAPTPIERVKPRVLEPQPSPPQTDDMPDLLTRGYVVLEGLEFSTGATSLGPGPFKALVALAEFLTANPGVRIALVGHTDSVGGLAGNIQLSKERATAVRGRLFEQYDIPLTRMDAEGMGYLSPRASNLTPSGREANRRVEAIILSAD